MGWEGWMGCEGSIREKSRMLDCLNSAKGEFVVSIPCLLSQHSLSSCWLAKALLTQYLIH